MTMPNMHPGERLLLYVLRELDDGSGRVTVTNGELAKRCGWSARYTVRKRLHGLVDRGLSRSRGTWTSMAPAVPIPT